MTGQEEATEVPTSNAAAAKGTDETEPGAEKSDQAQWREMLAEYRRALAKDPRNVELINELGQVAEAAGDMDRARWAYRRAIRLDPGYAPAYRNLGLMYKNEGRTDPAIEALQNSVRFAGNDVDLEPVVQALGELLGQEEIELSQLCEEAPGCNELAVAWEELGLTPAEAMMLLDPDSSGRQMLGYTLLDLTLRGVLELSKGDAIGRGGNFGQFELRPHEAFLAKYFSRLSDYVDVQRLAQAAMVELGNEDDNFKGEYVRQSLVDKGYLEVETQRVLGLIPVRHYVLSDKGLRVSKQLRRLLKSTRMRVDQAIKDSPGQAKAYLARGGPSILLMDEYPAVYFREWEERLTRMGFGPAIERLREKARGRLGAGK